MAMRIPHASKRITVTLQGYEWSGVALATSDAARVAARQHNYASAERLYRNAATLWDAAGAASNAADSIASANWCRAQWESEEATASV